MGAVLCAQATVFQRDRATLIFSTTHRAKGLGWQRVYLCDDYIARGLSVAEAAEAAKKALLQQGGRRRSTLELVGEPESLLAALRLSLTVRSARSSLSPVSPASPPYLTYLAVRSARS